MTPADAWAAFEVATRAASDSRHDAGLQLRETLRGALGVARYSRYVDKATVEAACRAYDEAIAITSAAEEAAYAAAAEADRAARESA